MPECSGDASGENVGDPQTCTVRNELAVVVSGVSPDASPAEPRAIDVSRRPGVQDALAAMTGRRTVPNVFIGGASVGGGDETVALRRTGELRPLLDAARAS